MAKFITVQVSPIGKPREYEFINVDQIQRIRLLSVGGSCEIVFAHYTLFNSTDSWRDSSIVYESMEAVLKKINDA